MNEYYAEAGENIRNFIRRIQKEMIKINQNNGFGIFNGIRFSLSYDSVIDDIATIYNLKCQLERNKT